MQHVALPDVHLARVDGVGADDPLRVSNDATQGLILRAIVLEDEVLVMQDVIDQHRREIIPEVTRLETAAARRCMP